ncbi:hypothetical protein [Streptomyces olivaceus]|uniref:hypothetical protein n=1 Tax=Streptomyces olivaceus TaxID=47716 RepID=UPI003699D1B9
MGVDVDRVLDGLEDVVAVVAVDLRPADDSGADVPVVRVHAQGGERAVDFEVGVVRLHGDAGRGREGDEDLDRAGGDAAAEASDGHVAVAVDRHAGDVAVDDAGALEDRGAAAAVDDLGDAAGAPRLGDGHGEPVPVQRDGAAADCVGSGPGLVIGTDRGGGEGRARVDGHFDGAGRAGDVGEVRPPGGRLLPVPLVGGLGGRDAGLVLEEDNEFGSGRGGQPVLAHQPGGGVLSGGEGALVGGAEAPQLFVERRLDELLRPRLALRGHLGDGPLELLLRLVLGQG